MGKQGRVDMVEVTRRFLADQDLWPAWPFLPLVRRRPGGGVPDTALAFYGRTSDDGLGLMIKEDGNLFTPDLTGAKIVTIEEVLQAGWVVD